MNWDKPYSLEDFDRATHLIMGELGYKFKEHHTGKKRLTWADFRIIDKELAMALDYEQYLSLCKKRNSKLYKALK